MTSSDGKPDILLHLGNYRLLYANTCNLTLLRWVVVDLVVGNASVLLIILYSRLGAAQKLRYVSIWSLLTLAPMTSEILLLISETKLTELTGRIKENIKLVKNETMSLATLLTESNSTLSPEQLNQFQTSARNLIQSRRELTFQAEFVPWLGFPFYVVVLIVVLKFYSKFDQRFYQPVKRLVTKVAGILLMSIATVCLPYYAWYRLNSPATYPDLVERVKDYCSAEKEDILTLIEKDQDVKILNESLELYYSLRDQNLLFFFSLTPLVVYLSVLSHNLYKHFAESRVGSATGQNAGNRTYLAISIILHAASYMIIPFVIEVLKNQTELDLIQLSPYNVSNEITLREYNRILGDKGVNLFDVNLTIREISAACKDRAGYYDPNAESIFVLSRFLIACRQKYVDGDFESLIVHNIFYRIQSRNLKHLDYYYVFMFLPLFTFILTYCIFP